MSGLGILYKITRYLRNILSKTTSIYETLNDGLTVTIDGDVSIKIRHWLEPVDAIPDLPMSGNECGDARVVKSENSIYVWSCDDNSWHKISGGGSGSFLGLTDTPDDYSGHGGDLVAVNSSEDGLEFVPPPEDSDEHVKVSSSDSTAGYLEDKLSAGSNITINKVGTGGNEQLVISSSGGSPGGLDGAVQYNDSGSFGGDDTEFYWDKTNKRLGIGTNSPHNKVSVHGDVDIQGNFMIGVDSPLGNDGFAQDSVFTIVAPALSDKRERVWFAKIADSNNYFSVINTTSLNGLFIPTFVAYAPDTDSSHQAVSFDGRIDSSADAGSYPIITFRVQQLDGVGAINSRPIAGFGSGTYGNDIKMVIMANGRVGILNTNPSRALTVGQSGDGTSAIANSWDTYSDERIKKDISGLDKGLAEISKLRPVKFKYLRDPDGRDHIGLLAQDVYRVIPEVVTFSDGLFSINYNELVAVLVKAIQDLSARVDELESKLSGG